MNVPDPSDYPGPKVLAGAIIDLVPRRCRKCIQHFEERPWIAEAFLSISLDGALTSADVAREFYREFHRNYHQEWPLHDAV